MTTQDFVKRIDLTGLTTVTGSEMNQLIDAAMPASDKGLTFKLKDTALNIPQVPNPAVLLEGIIPDYWTRYLWIREPFDSTGVIKIYAWNEELDSDATYLKWYDLGLIGANALAAALAAQTTATDANTLATTANTLAQNALDEANDAVAQAALANEQLTHNIEALNELETRVSVFVLTGEVRLYAGNRAFHSLSDGWLECDGTAYSRVTFSALFTAIGIAFGAGDGTTTFNVPNFSGRTPIGQGAGVGLTPRVMGTYVGEETHLLTSGESGVPAHTHNVPWRDNSCGSGSANHTGTMTDSINPATDKVASLQNAPADAVNPHNNMQPSLPIRFIIKT